VLLSRDKTDFKCFRQPLRNGKDYDICLSTLCLNTRGWQDPKNARGWNKHKSRSRNKRAKGIQCSIQQPKKKNEFIRIGIQG